MPKHQTTRERVYYKPVVSGGAVVPPSVPKPNPAQVAPRSSNESLAPRPDLGVRGAKPFLSYYSERLSATDISALASMKNVAKCDTWCELQDPANHRVFERKLRPEPCGRGHVCLGVTHRCPAHATPTLVHCSGKGTRWPPVRAVARMA